jgi:hypothetical protein
MKTKSWRTSLIALLCWTGAIVSMHWHLTHHPGKWFFNAGEFNDMLPQIVLAVQGLGHWHAADKQRKDTDK